jgi:hypothetical protein
VKPVDQPSNSTHHVAKASEHFLAESVSAVKVSSDATANVPTKTSEIPSLMLSSVDPTTKLMLSAADVETAFAVSVTATLVKTQKNLSAVNSANATTSRAIVTTAFSAPALIVVSVNADPASVTMDGVDQHASAAALLKLAKRPTVKSVRDMANASVENANAKSKTTSDIQESTARSAQHVQAVAMNSRTALSAKCTKREN